MPANLRETGAPQPTSTTRVRGRLNFVTVRDDFTAGVLLIGRDDIAGWSVTGNVLRLGHFEFEVSSFTSFDHGT